MLKIQVNKAEKESTWELILQRISFRVHITDTFSLKMKIFLINDFILFFFLTINSLRNKEINLNC